MFRLSGIILSTVLASTAIADSEPEVPGLKPEAETTIYINLPRGSKALGDVCPQLDTIPTQKNSIESLPDLNNPDYIIGELDMDGSNFSMSDFTFAINRMLRPETDTTFFSIHSNGGSASLANFLTGYMDTSPNTQMTYAPEKAGSAGLTILIAGSIGHRYITTETEMISHESRARGYPLSAYFEDSISAQAIIRDNQKQIDYFITQSVTGITEDCAAALIEPHKDTVIAPIHALQLGLVDHVIDWQNGTVTTRAPTHSMP